MSRRRTSVIQVMIAGDASDLNKATQSGSKGMGLLGAAAITAAKIVSSAVSGIAALSIREFARFDQAMTQSTAIMGDLSDSMRKDMADAARAVGTSTSFAAHEAAEAFFFLASAGLTAEQSIQALPQVAAFAQAGMFDLGRATDLLTDAQSALGLSSDDVAQNLEQMTRLSDVLVGANTLANASVEEFSAALTEKAGAALRQLGVDVEAGVAVLAVFADAGVKGSAAGTLLNTTMEGLTRTARLQEGAYSRLGVSVFDAQGEMRNMADIVGDLERALDGMSTEAQLAELASLGLTRQARDGVIQLLGNSEKIREYEAGLRSMGGVTQEVADKQMQSFSNQLALTRSQFTDIALTIGEALAGPLGEFNVWLRDQAPAIKAWVENAVPQFEAFVERAKVKFVEFKTFFDENLREPLTNFLTTLSGWKDIGIAEFSTMFDRVRNFTLEFKAALDENDPEEAGKLLGELIAETFRQAFARANIIGDAIKEWAGGEDWVAVGKAVGVIAVPFFKGFIQGLFSSPDAVVDEFGNETRTIADRLKNDFVSTVLGVFILSKVPGFRLLLRPFASLFSRLGSFIGGKIAALGLLAAQAFGRMLAGLAARVAVFVVTAFANFATWVMNGVRLGIAALQAQLPVLWQTFTVWLRGVFRNLAFRFTGVAGATIGRAMLLIGRQLLFGLGRAIVVGAAAIFGWPAVLLAAAAAAFTEFIRRFARWNEEQGDEYEGFGSKIVAFIGQGVVAMKDWFMETVGKWFADRWQDTKDLIGKIDWSAIGGDIIAGIARGIRNASIKVEQALLSAARNAWNATKDFFQSKSPSMLFAGLGGDLMLGMAQGIDKSAGLVADAMRDVSVQTAGVQFGVPDVPVGGQASGGDTFVINVSGALDAEGVARQIEKILRDSRRRTGGVLV